MTPTVHEFLNADARDLRAIADGSIDLVVTSPPYPMIAMWDDAFSAMSTDAATALEREDGQAAFEAMHTVLDDAWDECARVVRDGGIVCVNVGDAVRTVGRTFRLFPNHARILSSLAARGLEPLPLVIWRKPTNAPNKFMGSGMLPGGAYVTLEHEYVLVARKGGPRRPSDEADRARRRRSAIFWEERNRWFSDLWSIVGTRQRMLPGLARERSGAFPLELPHRLVAMYSWQGDTVLDPFGGTGTTTLAAIALARNSVHADTKDELVELARERAMDPGTRAVLAGLPAARLVAHEEYLATRAEPPAHRNAHLGVPVVTKQETDLRLPAVEVVEARDGRAIASYRDAPRREPRQLDLAPFDADRDRRGE